MSASTNSVLALSETSHVWAWGSNNHNQLGMYLKDDNTYETVVENPTLSDVYNETVEGEDWTPNGVTAGESAFVTYINGHSRVRGNNQLDDKNGGQLGIDTVNDADGNLALLPENINVVDACMLSDMVPTGFHGVELADVQFGDTVLVIGIGPVGLMSVAGANMRGAARIIAVGSRPVCVEAARKYGATDFVNYKNGPIFQQVLDMTDGKGVDKVIIAGGGVETFAEAVKCLKPGGKIGNVNYLGSGDNIDIPRVEWGVGMGHKQINGGLMPGGRLRMEKLGALVSAGKLDVSPLCTHVFEGWEHLEKALFLMRDKPRDLIKPIVKIAD